MVRKSSINGFKNPMSDLSRTFIFTINGQQNELKAATFSKVSKKAHQLMKDGVYEAVINRAIPEDAAEAFVKACRLQNFKVTSSNAFDLLDLSCEWKITNLEKFVRKYISSKGLTKPEPEDNTDYLSIFIEKMNRRELQNEDYINVAKRINKYISDERLLKIHTLPLFRLILASEYTPIDDQKLVDFVMKVIKQNPPAAVPLLLRVNYQLLTSEEDDNVFDTDEVHDQNIAFFVASSCSAARNRTNRILDSLERSIENSLNDTDREAKIERNGHIRSLNEEYRRKVNELKDIANSQRQRIEDLRKYREIMLDKRRQVNQEFNRREEELIEKQNSVNELMKQRRETTDILRDQISKEIGKQVGRVRQKVMDDFDDLREANKDKRDDGNDVRKNNLESLKRNIERMKKNTQMLKAAVKGTVDDKESTRSVLAAKMVSDFMRFDKFLRRTDKRYKAFDERSIWDLTGAQIKEAEKNLNSIERRVDKICPIRHTVTK